MSLRSVFFSSRRRHTRCSRDWSSDVCSSDLHLILEYEIPKYDGDLGAPNVFVHLDEAVCRAKIRNILDHFETQAGNQWFPEDEFRALMRLRGIESNAPDGYAEAFHGRKLALG